MSNVVIDISKPYSFVATVFPDPDLIIYEKIKSLVYEVISKYSYDFMEYHNNVRQILDKLTRVSTFMPDTDLNIPNKIVTDRLTYLCTYIWWELFDPVKHFIVYKDISSISIISMDTQILCVQLK